MMYENKIKSEYIILRNLTFIFMLGFLVYHWFTFPPIIWRIGLVLISMVGLFIHIKEFIFTNLEKAMLAFVCVNVLYFFISYLWQNPELTNFGNVLCATLPMFLFYVLSANGAITKQSLFFFSLLSIVLGMFYFRNAENVAFQRYTYGDYGDYTINASTIFLVIIPLLFFFKNKLFIICSSIVIIFFVIYSAKRGNVVSMSIPLYLLFRYQLKVKKSIFKEVLLVIVIFGLSYFAYSIMLNSDYLLNRLEQTMEGDTSGRSTIYSHAMSLWINSQNIYNLIFGYGTDATSHLLGIRAHNDWLEILVDFGLLGALFYFAFFVYLLKMIWKNRKSRTVFYLLVSVFFIWFSKTMYSMGFTENLFSYLSMQIGIVAGNELRRSNGLSTII